MGIWYSSNVNDNILSEVMNLQINLSTLLSDSEVKKIILGLNGVEKPDKQPRLLRIDGFTESKIGILSCLGTNAVLAERIISALHHYERKNIEAIVFICDSEEVSWWKQHQNKDKLTTSLGNRSNSKNLISHLRLIPWLEVPVIVYSIQNQEASIQHQSFFK
jgi:hypothetical protein